MRRVADQGPRLHSVRAAEEQPSCSDDVKSLKSDFNALKRRKMYAAVLSLLVFAQWCVLSVQLSGVVISEDDWLEDSSGSRDTSAYHIITVTQSVCIVLQILCLTKWYQLRLMNQTYFDRMWRDVGLWESPHRVAYILEVIVLLMHEPPYLVLAWHNAYKLQALALLRCYIFFNLFRGQSYNVTVGGRLVCSIARVTNNKWFQVRYWGHEAPATFMLSCAASGWFLLSVAMFMAEGLLSFEESMWLTFITMTTVGYGDFSPQTSMGRFIAVIAALHGLVSSAMLINIFSNSFSMSPAQKRVADFVKGSKISSALEDMSVRIVQVSFQRYLALMRGHSKKARGLLIKLKHLCHRYRQTRREFRTFQLSVHNHGEVFDLDSRLNRIEARIGALAGVKPPRSSMGSPAAAVLSQQSDPEGQAKPQQALRIGNITSEHSDVASVMSDIPAGTLPGDVVINADESRPMSAKSFVKRHSRNVVHQCLSEIVEKLDTLARRQDELHEEIKGLKASRE
eukprot:TRINITY_DN11848_c4_g1_i1.p1 TRINITY_DN11848_c4_g1~~TRINITY_DN11848_c4_g1_i1.p1  ORF type:complete len:528 (+),score=208.04 TRINITY_DN11848_c4_g1_i1:55-1584(+)